jgi:hypothetical protein
MVVQHPEYGFGEIVAMSGAGPKRIATVKFYDDPANEKKFRVLLSPLVPADAE